MDLRQLQHFVVLAEESHFARAARRVSIVQSALSSSIRSLEAELGTDLFERSTRRVKMTAAGRALYEKARTVLAGAREAREAVAAGLGLKRGLLVIGAGPSRPRLRPRTPGNPPRASPAPARKIGKDHVSNPVTIRTR